MTSKKQQLINVKAALVTIQDEIKEAKEERRAAKSQLEKALAEGKPTAPYEKLFDSASSNLTSLQREKAERLRREAQLTRSPSTSDEEI